MRSHNFQCIKKSYILVLTLYLKVLILTLLNLQHILKQIIQDKNKWYNILQSGVKILKYGNQSDFKNNQTSTESYWSKFGGKYLRAHPIHQSDVWIRVALAGKQFRKFGAGGGQAAQPRRLSTFEASGRACQSRNIQ